MFKNLLFTCAGVLLVASTGSAYADTIFSLNDSACSSGCAVLPAGTVTLAQNGANNVLVTVQLTPDYSFQQSPSPDHYAFVFDSSVSVTGVSDITSGPTSQTFTYDGAGSYKDAGLAGNNPFDYAFTCTTCAKGATSTPTQDLSFDVTGTGLTTSSFIANNGDYFGVDVVGLDSAAGVGLTGNIGATGPGAPTSVTPEPSSVILLGTGLLGIAGTLRRKLSA